MMYLVSLPEIAYIQKDGQVLDRWCPPDKFFFKYSVHELKDNTSMEEIKNKLLVSNSPVYLDKDEIAYYKKKYR